MLPAPRRAASRLLDLWLRRAGEGSASALAIVLSCSRQAVSDYRLGVAVPAPAVRARIEIETNGAVPIGAWLSREERRLERRRLAARAKARSHA